MTLLWNNALSEDIARGHAVKFLSFGKRDEYGMYVETITNGRLTRYYAQVNPFGIIASEEYDEVQHPSLSWEHLCRACNLDVASGVGDGLCDWCASHTNH